MKPASVKAAASKADDLIRSLQNGQAPENTDETVADTVDDGAEADVIELAEADETPPAEPPKQPAAADSDLKKRLEDTETALQKAEQKWKTLDGMIRAQNQQIENYQQLLANVQVPQKTAADDTGGEGSPKKTFTQADVDQFGEDWVEFVHRVAHEIVRKEVRALASEMDGLKGTVAQQQKTVALTAQERFEMKLDELAPEWRAHDADEGFLEWLRGSRVNSAGFTQGVETLDHEAVAEVFNAYTKFKAPAPAVQEKADKRKQKLEAQVSPGKARQVSPASRAAPEEKIWTMSEIKQAYAAQKDRATRLAANEFSALEREIADAQKEGRVDYTR